MEFWTYYRIVRRRYKLIAIGAIVGLVIGLITILPWWQEYVATVSLTTISPDQGGNVLVLITDRTPPPANATAMAIGVIRSRTVAERVVQRLNLNRTTQDLRRRLRVGRGLPGEGEVITLTFRDRDPGTAVLVANAFAETAVAYNQEVNRREAALARQFIEQELADTKIRLEQAETSLDTFKRRNGIVALSTQINAEVSRFTSLSGESRNAALEEREISARIAAIRMQLRRFGPYQTDQTVTKNPVAERLRGELVNLQVLLATSSESYTDDHPVIIATKRKIKAVETAIEREVKKVVTEEFVRVNPIHENLLQTLVNLEVQRVAVQSKQAAVTAVLSNEQRRLPTLTQIEREYIRLTRDVTILETAYTNLEARLNEFRIQEQAANNRNLLYIMDPATAAQTAASTTALMRTLLAAMLGLTAGLGVVLFQHQIDNRLKNGKDAERLLAMPVLSTIPQHNPPFDEAYRLLKTSLFLHLSNGQPRTILFTSTKAGSGTSTVVYHLARAIASGGKRVIVVDADLRRPMAQRLFGAVPVYGLLDVLKNGTPIDDALAESSKVENVKLLPAGAMNGDELADVFASPRMLALLSELKKRADVVLIDAPPALPFAETGALAAVADGVVLVIAAGEAPRGIEEEAKRHLERARARLLGVVVNRVSPEFDDGYYLYTKYEGNEHARQPEPAAKQGG
jgi:succinoglycan biosynthesis transport protein ExoP